MVDEKPTVQMEASPEEPADDHGMTPATIPIDDVYREPEWSQPGQAQTPTPRPFRPARSQPPQADSAGQTVIMEEPLSTSVLGWLAVTGGPGGPRGQIYTLRKETVIGRKSGQIVLSGDAYVSGQHAKVRLESSEGDDQRQVFVLYDLASANGTYAGDRDGYRDNRVYRHVLEDGEFVLLGETTLVFKQVRLASGK